MTQGRFWVVLTAPLLGWAGFSILRDVQAEPMRYSVEAEHTAYVKCVDEFRARIVPGFGEGADAAPEANESRDAEILAFVDNACFEKAYRGRGPSLELAVRSGQPGALRPA
ncbi:MAG: hypothetical protein R3C52_05355 [Hyphomonadaceae bacterium]